MQQIVRNRPLQLAGLAILSVAIYVGSFLIPYSLMEWWRVPLMDVAKISHDDPMAMLNFAAAMGLLFLGYVLAFFVLGKERTTSLWAVIIGGAIAFNLVMILLYPVGATDIFDNIIRGRMQAFYGANPFYQTPVGFVADPLYPYSAWREWPTAYGPLWEMTASLAARLAGDGVVANVLTFKLVSILAYALTAVLIALILRRRAPDRMLSGVLLFTWNPLMIYSVAGNGHNDAVMVFFVVLGFYFLDRGQFTLAALAETGGMLAKFVPALLVPVVMLAALKQLQGLSARVRYFLVTTVLCASTVVAFYAPYYQGGDVLGAKWRTDLYTTSLPTILKDFLDPRIGTALASTYVTRLALFALLVWVGWRLLALWESKDRDAPIAAGLSIVLFYLLISCLWFQPWYLIWPLGLAALLPAGKLRQGATLASYTASWKMPVFFFALTRLSLPWAFAWPDVAVTGIVAAPVWVFFLYSWLEKRLGVLHGQPDVARDP